MLEAFNLSFKYIIAIKLKIYSSLVSKTLQLLSINFKIYSVKLLLLHSMLLEC